MIRSAQRAAEVKPVETTAPQTPPMIVQVPVATPGWQQPWVLLTVVGFIVLGIVALTVTRGTKRAAVESVEAPPVGGEDAALFVDEKRAATVAVDVPPATLYDRSGRSGKERYPIREPVLRIGRDAKTNDVVIPEETVSSLHAAIEFRAGAFYLQDLRSKNGTFVNGKQVSDSETIREAPLKNRDRIRFDAYEFEFIIDALKQAGQTVVAGATPAGGTRLRSPEPPRPHIAEEVADGSAPAEGTPESGDGEAATKLKSDMCPHHASFKASELCSVCGKAYCKVFCMKETDGQVFCPEGHVQP